MRTTFKNASLRPAAQSCRPRVHRLDRSTLPAALISVAVCTEAPDCRIVSSNLDDRNVTPGPDPSNPGVIVGFKCRLAGLFVFRNKTAETSHSSFNDSYLFLLFWVFCGGVPASGDL